MRVVDQQMLKEENRVERRDELDGHQILVGRQGLQFAADRRVASQPLQEGLLFLAAISLQILHVALVALLLIRMWCTELLGLLVGPRHLDVGQLEGHLWSQGTDAPQEQIGGLEAVDVCSTGPPRWRPRAYWSRTTTHTSAACPCRQRAAHLFGSARLPRGC